MLKCMALNGFLSDEADMKTSPQDPYEYLQTAELNQRSVGFIPAGTKVSRSVAPKRGHCPDDCLHRCTLSLPGFFTPFFFDLHSPGLM